METKTKDSGFSTNYHNRADRPSPLNTPGPDTQTVHPGVSQQDMENRVHTADGRVTGTKG